MAKLFHVDAFTDVPFKGNPAAVCFLEKAQPDKWMLDVAAEMNLSETAFLLQQSDGFGLRWFTPKKEVSLCGHATLASAHILWEEQISSPSDAITFSTASGELTARNCGDSIELDFPARIVEPTGNHEKINQALGSIPTATYKYVTPKGAIYLLELATEEAARNLSPDFRKLAATDARAVIVTAMSAGPEQDFVSRYFAPAVGIDEDPVTGSAHCCLAPYWSTKLKKYWLTGYQASQRGGFVKCRHMGERVQIQGRAITLFRTTLPIQTT